MCRSKTFHPHVKVWGYKVAINVSEVPRTAVHKPFLAKHGIKSVSDNVSEGYHVRPPKGVFVMLFEDELMNSPIIIRGATEKPTKG